MSGRRIDDHSSPFGMRGKDCVFPDGPHKVVTESSAEGAGEVMEYQDTTDSIKRSQVMGDKKARSHKQKTGYRN